VINSFVIVRTRDAGVHCGTLSEIGGTVAILKDARRIWRWRGANSLNELAVKGAAKDFTRISEAVDIIMLTEAIEVIPCTKEATKNLSQSRWSNS
jgi:hypothetical protein